MTYNTKASFPPTAPEEGKSWKGNNFTIKNTPLIYQSPRTPRTTSNDFHIKERTLLERTRKLDPFLPLCLPTRSLYSEFKPLLLKVGV